MAASRFKATALASFTLYLAAASPAALPQTTATPTLSVDAAAARASINPDIYGIANYGLDAAFATEIQVGNIRWGGDGTSRYNWQADSSNAGYDWYFMGGNGDTTAPVPGASPDLMINTYKPAKAHALITIPILPYVNKSYAWTCSFPVAAYGAQTSTNPYVFPVVNGVKQTCGNSIAAVATNGSTQLQDSNILANHIANSVSLQQGWVQHLVSTFGTGAAGGVKYYQLDNEPLGWSNTHRDVQPTTPTYATIVQLGQSYAFAIKQTDATALVMGPSDFTLGGWVGTASQQGGLWAGQYYLQQMAAYEQNHHTRILDYFDEHYYFDTSTPAAQLAATRTLWDPTYNGETWVEQYDFKGPMQLIPRFKNWITTYYPGTKLSLSEYSIDSGQKSIVDAIAEMDVLGIFGREQLDFANMWSPPAPTDPIAYAFRMFRNYDGNGGQFGDTSLSAMSSDQGSLSIYAAQRSSDSAITILAINKTSAAITTALALANVNLPTTAQVYSYSAANLKAIVPAAAAPISAGALTYTFPGYSAVLFVVQPAAAATKTVVSASPTPADVGDAVTFTVNITAPGATPGGSVALTDGSTSLGSVTLTNGAASFSTTSLAVGGHTITASYAGNATDAPSRASVMEQINPAGDYTLSLSNSEVTATTAKAAALEVTVAPKDGFAGTVAFTCSGLPAGWACSFAPPRVSITTAQTTTLTVQAMHSSSNGPPASGVLLAILTPCSLALIGIGGNRRKVTRALWLAIAAAMLVGCGGDSHGDTGSNTYSVTVSASSGAAAAHTQVFNLTVAAT